MAELTGGKPLTFAQATVLAREVGKARGWPDRGEGLSAHWVALTANGIDETDPDVWMESAEAIPRVYPEAEYPGAAKLASVYARNVYLLAEEADREALRSWWGQTWGALAGMGGDVVSIGTTGANAVRGAGEAAGMLAQGLRSPWVWLALLGLYAAERARR